MNPMSKILITTVAGVGLLGLGAVGGAWRAGQALRVGPAAPATAASAPAAERKVLYWYDPMVPQQRFDKPGKSPFMDMDLVPRYAEEGSGSGSPGVQIDPRVAQNLGLRRAVVERIALATVVDATGIIGFNERDVSVEQARVGGFVERVWPLAPGDVIAAGQPLAELLVPEWAGAQHELLALRGSGDADLLVAARERLRLLGMHDSLVRELEHTGQVRTRFVIGSSRAGVLQTLEVRAGMTLAAGQTLARVNGLSTVWLDVAVPEAAAGGVRVGARASVTLAAVPETTLVGRVTALLPALAEASRSLRVRVELPNRDARLRPGMSAQVRLAAAGEASALAVPTEALIRTGKRSLVMLVQGEGRYAPVEVTLGPEVGARTVVTSGLSEGQKVVSSGQFLIDSEASLAGVLARASAAEPERGETLAAASPPVLHEADAVVGEIDEKEVTLTHGPFETLSMPGMTMVFALARPDLAHGLEAGDKVRVAVRQTEAGLLVERLDKRGARP